MNLQFLEDIFTITNKDLDIICKQIVNDELSKADVTTLIEEVTNLVDMSHATTNDLRVKLLEAAAAIKATNPDSGTSTPREPLSPDVFSEHFQATIAKEIANLKVGTESRPASKSINDFGFSKIPIPNFQGNIRDFTKW